MCVSYDFLSYFVWLGKIGCKIETKRDNLLSNGFLFAFIVKKHGRFQKSLIGRLIPTLIFRLYAELKSVFFRLFSVFLGIDLEMAVLVKNTARLPAFQE